MSETISPAIGNQAKDYDELSKEYYLSRIKAAVDSPDDFVPKHGVELGIKPDIFDEAIKEITVVQLPSFIVNKIVFSAFIATLRENKGQIPEDYYDSPLAYCAEALSEHCLPIDGTDDDRRLHQDTKEWIKEIFFNRPSPYGDSIIGILDHSYKQQELMQRITRIQLEDLIAAQGRTTHLMTQLKTCVDRDLSNKAEDKKENPVISVACLAQATAHYCAEIRKFTTKNTNEPEESSLKNDINRSLDEAIKYVLDQRAPEDQASIKGWISYIFAYYFAKHDFSEVVEYLSQTETNNGLATDLLTNLLDMISLK